MKFFIIPLIYFFTMFFNACTSLAQEKKDYVTAIDSLLSTTHPSPFNGVILITKKGKNKYAKAMGYTRLGEKKPLNLQHPFEIMSISKQITSVLLLKEVEKGNIDLHAPIKKYLPNLTSSWADTVTVHHLLNHTHGIIDMQKPLLFKAGSNFKYGNLSNILLGKIIENSTQKSYTSMATDLFQQLKMLHTFPYHKQQKNNTVYGHLVDKNNFQIIETSGITDESIPANGIMSTVADLVRWNSLLHNGKILQPESYKLMTTASAKSQHDVFGNNEMGYGYNIRILKENDINYFGHTGLGDGFACLNLYIPKKDINIVVIENQMYQDSSLYYYYEKKIKDIILKSSLVN